MIQTDRLGRPVTSNVKEQNTNTLILAAFLIAMLVCGAFAWRMAYLLQRGRSEHFAKKYRDCGVPEEKIGSLGKSYSVLFFAAGSWLLALPFFIILYRLPISAWGGLIMVSTGLFFVGDRVIHRRHGVAAP